MSHDALVFDAYGTLFDVHSVVRRCEECWPGNSNMESLMKAYLELSPYADVPGTLKKLAGKKTAILSNGSPDLLLPLVSHSGLSFDAVLSVDELKIYKPAPQVYQLAVDRLKTRNIGLVSSNCWDALGAKSFGFRVYWINRTGSPVDRLGFQPDRIGKSLDEVLL